MQTFRLFISIAIICLGQFVHGTFDDANVLLSKLSIIDQSTLSMNQEQILSFKQLRNMVSYKLYDTHLMKLCGKNNINELISVDGEFDQDGMQIEGQVIEKVLSGNRCREYQIIHQNDENRRSGKRTIEENVTVGMNTQTKQFIYKQLHIGQSNPITLRNYSTHIALGKLGKFQQNNNEFSIMAIEECCIEIIRKQEDDSRPEYIMYTKEKKQSQNLLEYLRTYIELYHTQPMDRMRKSAELVKTTFQLQTLGITHNQLNFENILMTEFGDDSSLVHIMVTGLEESDYSYDAHKLKMVFFKFRQEMLQKKIEAGLKKGEFSLFLTIKEEAELKQKVIDEKNTGTVEEIDAILKTQEDKFKGVSNRTMKYSDKEALITMLFFIYNPVLLRQKYQIKDNMLIFNFGKKINIRSNDETGTRAINEESFPFMHTQESIPTFVEMLKEFCTQHISTLNKYFKVDLLMADMNGKKNSDLLYMRNHKNQFCHQVSVHSSSDFNSFQELLKYYAEHDDMAFESFMEAFTELQGKLETIYSGNK